MTETAGRPEHRLDELVRALGSELVESADDTQSAGAVGGVAVDSRRVEPGDVFVAITGRRHDGRAYADDAVAAGAVAVVTDGELTIDAPVVRVHDARRAAAVLAAEVCGRPADRLKLVGVTGTVGKTTVVTMLESILTAAGRRPGVIGSLGSGYGNERRNTGMTTPGPVELHEGLERIARETDRALLEVTSHALKQERVHGLRFELGVFTNLVMLEHQEYHENFAAYVRAKMRFFEHLAPGAPLVHPAGDRLVAEAVREHDVTPISCGSGPDAVLHIERTAMTSHGTRLLFQLEQPLPLPDGGEVPMMTFPAALQLLGRAAVNNASLAAAAALMLGADAETVAHALAQLRPPRRRMQIERLGGLTVLDDTVGHPDSVTGVFEVTENVPHHRLYIVYAVRGGRGPEINRRDAEAVGIWSQRLAPEWIAVTDSASTTDDANRVDADERTAFVEALTEADVPHSHHPELADAIDDVLGRAGSGDLVLLLGAQGMDAGLGILQDRLDQPAGA